MHTYTPPIQDMMFHIKTSHANTPAMPSPDDCALILSEMARFVTAELVPINAEGDRQGCTFKQGQVFLPTALRQALATYGDGGWMGLTLPEHWGGQGLSPVLGGFTGEMLTSSNQSFSMFPALTMSACKALMGFASKPLQDRYLPNLVTGRWLGTMCLTEAHCGSDLGLIKTRAIPGDNSCAPESYTLHGTKIFISAGEHDGAENIIHLVLARIQGAPEGVKGISLFLVPKWIDGQRNAVECIGLEEKMGIHANPTCTLSFEGATGYLVGEPHKGLRAMFAMMNEMRLGAAIQGVGLSEQAFQASYAYARERRQGKALNAAERSEAAADALLCHADIRRMLLTQKAFAEGGRALTYLCHTLLAEVRAQNDNSPDAANLLGFLTPIAKAFLTETGLESASHAIQVLGGHGYICESGVEQIYRDGRISTLYEGTTGIQALDLLGRKVLADQGHALRLMTRKIHVLCKDILNGDPADKRLRDLAEQLFPYAERWGRTAQQIGVKALRDHDEVGAASVDFLHYSGYLCLGYCWLKMARDALTHADTLAPACVTGKLKTARFYFERLLPRADAHETMLLNGKDNLTNLTDDEWLM